jgi:excisionase family DNA binding protein
MSIINAAGTVDLAPISYRIEDAAKVTGISRSSLYALISDGTLRSVKAAGRRLILADDLRAFLESQREAA